MKNHPPHDESAHDLPATSEQSVILPLALDPDKYRDHLEEFDLTPEQQNELLETLWHILRTIVDIGFGLDSVQLFSLESSEKTGKTSGRHIEQAERKIPFNQAVRVNDIEKEPDNE